MKLYCLVDGDEFVTYGVANRSKWSKGPWDDEPEDHVHWVDLETGLDCLAMRNDTGEWCGYVGVPRSNKCYGENTSGTNVLGIEIHGGVTYASSSSMDDYRIRPFLKGRPEVVWWIGFDTGNLRDACPGRDKPAAKRMWQPIYRDLDFMRREITGLAEQLAED